MARHNKGFEGSASKVVQRCVPIERVQARNYGSQRPGSNSVKDHDRVLLLSVVTRARV
jgi:hypothetical protein